MSFKVSNIIQFPQSTLQYISQDEFDLASRGLPLLGGILSDTRHVWHAKGPSLEVRDSKTGIKVGAWTFGYILKDSNTKVVCVDEIQRSNGRLSLLAVGIECAISGSLICVFNIFGSKVIRAIQIKEKITNLHVVDSGCEVLNLPGPLRNFDGIIAIGTEGGNVYLVDICKQICEEALCSITVRDELCPCQLILLTVKNIPTIEYYKERSVREGDHLAVHLNIVLNSLTQHFILKGPKGEDRIHVNKEEVVTSALYYCPQLTSLLVGFNFGAFQLWDLTKLKLIYTSPVCEEHIPITHFALQEPADDPRAFCYFWVSYSNIDLFEPGLPFAVMYSVCYESKEHHEGYGYLYQDFQSCSVRFQVELGQLEERSPKAKGGYCVGLQPICKVPANKDLYSYDSVGDTLALCVISWSVWFSQNETQTYTLLFDLNQWYKEQMPEFTKWVNCSNFILKASISELTKMRGHKGGPFLDVKVNRRSLRQFTGVQRLEEHFCPSALSFDMWGLRENDAVLLRSEGIQNALLAQIEATGPLCLIRPNDVYRQVIALGLTPLFTDISMNTSISTEIQRETILNAGLEHQLVGWLCKCASEWANGSFSSAGCSLDFLVYWAFQRAVVLKMNCDKYCTPLFDYSQLRLDNNTSILLNSCIRQINSLCTFYSYVANKLRNFISNPELVAEQHTSLKMVSTYFEVLQWLVNVGLLPECHPSTYPRPDNTERISAPYPVQELAEYYNEKRAQLQMLSRETFVSSDSLLFIDNLINNKCGAELLQKQWQEDGGSGLYPPPSLQSMLRTYLVEGTEISHKHSLILYVFLDLAMALDQSRYAPVITHLIKFPAVFKVSSSIIKITQAFWQLDHGDFATAMEQLLDPFVLGNDLEPWHHAIAMRALLLQNQHNFALLYMQVRKPPVTDDKDVLTAISLFIANGMLDEAFYFKNQHQNNNEEKLLMHLFNECNKNESLHVLLYKYLNTGEEKAFLKYLKSRENPTADDMQVFYYLLRSRFVEAFDAHHISRRKTPECQGLIGQRNATKTDQIVRIFKTLLPDVNRNIVDIVRKERTNLWKEVARPTPLSVFVHNTDEQIQYKSTLIHAALAKAKHTFNDSMYDSRLNDVLTEETPFLRTPTARKKSARCITPVITPKMIEINENGEEVGPTPSKRLKLTPRATTTSPTWRRTSLVHSKMLTPIVKRKSALQKDHSLLSNSKVCTPQSILKVRNLVRNSDGTIADDTLENYDELAKIDTSPNKSSLGLLPRKSLTRSPRRQQVKFDDAARFSSSLSDQSVKQSLNNTTLEIQSPEKSTLSSKDVSLMVSSKNSSTSNTDEVFYSPDSSVSELSKSHEESSAAVENIEINDEVNTDVQVDDNKEDTKVDDAYSHLIMQSPKARRSYKRSLVEASPIRSSPRLSKKSSETNEKEHMETHKDNTVDDADKSLGHTPVVLDTKTESPLSKQSPRLLQKVKGRKSLSRKVLEHNTFAKMLSTPSLRDNVTSEETSFAQREEVVVSEQHLNSSEITTVETKMEISGVCILDSTTPSGHSRSASSSVSKRKVFESTYEEEDKPDSGPMTPVATARHSASSSKGFDSSYLDSDSSYELNINMDTPKLPEHLRLSDSLLEYIKFGNKRPADLDQSIAESHKTQEESDGVKDRKIEPQAKSKTLEDGKPESAPATPATTARHSASRSKGFDSSYLDSDSSYELNINMDTPKLPEHLRLSDSLLEYIKFGNKRPADIDQSITESHKTQEESDGVKARKVEQQAKSKTLEDGKPESSPATPAATVRHSASSSKGFDSSYLDSDSSYEHNINMDTPKLPEHLRLSDSLLEYIKFGNKRPADLDQSIAESHKTQKKSDGVKDGKVEPQADSKTLKGDKSQLKQIEVYEDLSSGAEDIEEVLTANKREGYSSKGFVELLNVSESTYNKLERNIFDITESAEPSFEGETERDNKNVSIGSVNSEDFDVPEADKAFIAEQTKLQISEVRVESCIPEVEKSSLAEDRSPKTSKQENEIIEIGSSSDNEESTEHSNTTESRSFEKSESDVDDLNISYERNIHVEENSRSLIDSEFSRTTEERLSGSEEADDDQAEGENVEHNEESRNSSELEINEDNSSVEWINNDHQSGDEENEHVEQEAEKEDKSTGQEAEDSEGPKSVGVENVIEIMVEISDDIRMEHDENIFAIVQEESDIASNTKDGPVLEKDEGETMPIEEADIITEKPIEEIKEMNKENTEDTYEKNKTDVSKEKQSEKEVDKADLQVQKETLEENKAGALEAQTQTDEDCVNVMQANVKSVDKKRTETDVQVEEKQKTFPEKPETSEKQTNTSRRVLIDKTTSIQDDEIVTEVLEIQKPKDRNIYHPKYGTMRVVTEDQTVSSVSSDTTEGEITKQEIVVTAQVHAPSKKRAETQSTKRITRRSSAVFDSAVEPDISVSVSHDVIDQKSHRLVQAAATMDDSNVEPCPDDTFVPGRRTRRSQSATQSPATSVKTRTRSFQVEEPEQLGTASTSKDTEKQSTKLSRRTRSISVDEINFLSPRKRSLRSSSIDEEAFDSVESHPPKPRGKAASVSQLPVITEKKKHGRRSGTSSMVEAYATTRRLTRRQASLIKGIETPSSVTAQDDSDVEKDLDVDAIDPINLLDKEPFQGKPDPEEEKMYEASSPSNSTVSSFNTPAKKTSRSASMASDSSLPPSVSQTSTPKRRSRKSVSHTNSPSPSGVKTRSKKKSETSSIASEKSDRPSPPKRSRKKEAEEAGSTTSTPTSTRTTRNRTNSTSSATSDASNSSKRATRGRRLVSAKSDLPEIVEEKGSEMGDTGGPPASKRQTRKKNSQ